jgi:hypothetical protein
LVEEKRAIVEHINHPKFNLKKIHAVRLTSKGIYQNQAIIQHFIKTSPKHREDHQIT